MDDAAFQASLNEDQKAYFGTAITSASEAAVTKHKTDAEEARKKGIPDKYELKPAEKSALEATDLERISQYAKSNGLSQEQAAALLKHSEETATSIVGRKDTAAKTEREAWAEKTKTDKEVGGEHYAQTLIHVKRVADRFFPKDSAFSKFLEETGYGNHPEWVRFINSIGRAMGEDTPGSGQPAIGGDKKLKADHEVFFN